MGNDHHDWLTPSITHSALHVCLAGVYPSLTSRPNPHIPVCLRALQSCASRSSTATSSRSQRASLRPAFDNDLCVAGPSQNTNINMRRVGFVSVLGSEVSRVEVQRAGLGGADTMKICELMIYNVFLYVYKPVINRYISLGSRPGRRTHLNPDALPH